MASIASSRWEELLESEEYSDVTFTVGEGEDQEEIKGHKLLIAIHSPVLAKLVYPEESTNSVEVTDIEPAIFKLLMKAIYTGSAEIDEENVKDCMKAAEAYEVDALLTECTNFLTEGVNVDNFFAVYKSLGESHQDALMSFLSYNLTNIIKKKEWESLPLSFIETVVSQEALNIGEVDLFDAVHRWTIAQCKKEEKDPNPENKRKLLGENVISNIRFPLIPLTDFATKVTPSGLLTADDQVALYQFYAAKITNGLKFSVEPRTVSKAKAKGSNKIKKKKLSMMEKV